MAGTIPIVLSVKELRALGASLPLEIFLRQLGPFALIQRPESPASSAVLAPTRVATPQEVEQGVLSMLFEFEDLLVVTLPPLAKSDSLTIGRLPGCDLVLEEATVSRRHAVLRWSEAQGHCTVKDLGSAGGTFLNATTIGTREVPLRDGDIISLGKSQFWFLLTETLHKRLRHSEYARMRSHSG
ncbi:FHA domain-containing protein [Myxococcaceae bacterium GXIMD 01537]